MAGDTRLGLLATLREIWCKLGQWCQKIPLCVSLSAVAASLVRPSPTSSVALGPDPSSSRAPESLARRRGSPAAFWRWIGAMVRRSNNWHVAASSCTPSWLRKLVATGATAEWSPIPAQRLNTTVRDVPQSAHPDGWRKVSLWIVDLGSADTTAQVHPAQFTAAMMHAAQAQGAELRLARVTGLMRSGSVVTGVETDGGRIECDAVVIAMGPWSIMASSWLPLPAVFGLKGHSLVFDTGSTVPAEALFLEYREATGNTLSPEVFPRSNGTTYVCAISSESPLPADPGSVVPG